MKKVLFVLLALLPLTVMAQNPYMGYVSYKTILEQMPDYAKAMQDLESLRAQYEAEAQHGEAEFQRKFVDFLQGQQEFPKVIMQKRQMELQTLMDNGVEFRKQMQSLLEQARKDLTAPVEASLQQAIKAVGQERGYICILNTDNNGVPYVQTLMCEDATVFVLAKLGLVKGTSGEMAPNMQSPVLEETSSAGVQE